MDTLPVSYRCTEHRIDKESVIEYFDGTFVAQCIACGDSVEMDRVPGGSLHRRTQSLLHVINNNRIDQVHRIELEVLKNFMKEDIAAMKETARLLSSIEEILCQP